MRPISEVVATNNLLLRATRRVSRRRARMLPDRLAVPVVAARSYGRPSISDEREIPGPGALRSVAYWLRFGGDEGPAVSAFYGREEILRLDGLRGSPHVHYGLSTRNGSEGGETRVHLPPMSDAAMLERIHHELSRNLPFCLGDHPRRAVRDLTIDRAEARTVADAVHEHLAALVDRRSDEHLG